MSRPQKKSQAFDRPERALAAELGIGHDVLKAVRHAHLEEGLDWRREGGEVRYAESGHLKALEALKIADGPQTAAEATPAAGARPPAAPSGAQKQLEPGDEVELECVKVYRPNRTIVEARLGAEIVRVRMRDNRNMRPKMVMRCRYSGTPIWELAQRCPRFPGKW